MLPLLLLLASPTCSTRLFKLRLLPRKLLKHSLAWRNGCRFMPVTANKALATYPSFRR